MDFAAGKHHFSTSLPTLAGLRIFSAGLNRQPAESWLYIGQSAGVIAGNKLGGSTPQYPAIAKAARIQGTVVLQATISKTGTIENLRVLSGPPMLQQAALESVKTWRYKPYLLNGEPVEIETEITVKFKLP